MADVSKIKLPNGTTYNIKDDNALPLTGGSVTGPVSFGDSVSIDEATVGDLVVNGSASFTNNLQANTINGVTVGSNPKFTDTNTVTTATTTGSGNAVTAVTASNGALTITKGTTFLTAHNTYTISNSGSGNAVTGVSLSGTTFTVTKGTTFLTSHQDISGKADKATTLAGYGITDAKIASGVITLGSNTITPLTSSSTLSAAKLSGAIPSAVTATTQASTDNSTKIATTAYVTTAIANLPEPMVFKGSVGTGGTVTSLPTAAASNEGWTYKVITVLSSPSAKVGDTVISNGSSWVVIPSGDEPSGTVTSVAVSNGGGLSVSGSPITSSGTITISHADTSSQASSSNSGRTYIQSLTLDTYGHVTGISTATETVTDTNTWRTIQVNGTDALGSGTGTGKLNLKAGTNVSLSNSSGTVTINATDTTYESKAAANGGTAVSLVTTGEKYIWNSKTSNTGTITSVKTTAGTHTTINVSSGAVSFNVPTKTSHLTNDSGFITNAGVTGVKGNAESSYRTGQVNLTPANLGAVGKNDELLTTNPFRPTSLSGPYISKIDNGFYAADKRWNVSMTNISGSVSSLFDGSYESTVTISAGKTSVLTMDFTPSTYFPGYPYGYILISFYHTGIPTSISGRVYCNYESHGIGWHNISFSPVSDSGTSSMVYRSEHQGYYNISQLEISIVGASNPTTKVSQIEIHLDRPDSSRTPFLSKYQAETLYYDLTAPNFRGNLVGNVTGNVSGTAGGVAWANVSGKPTATGSKVTGITIAAHGTGTVIGVQSTTTTASKVTVGSSSTDYGVKSAGSASTWTFEEKTIPNVTAAGSGSASLTFAMDTTDTKKLKITFSHTHTAPTIGTAIKVQSKSGGSNGTAPTLGSKVPTVSASDVTVPIKNTSASTFVTGTTHTVTDNGHTHTI